MICGVQELVGQGGVELTLVEVAPGNPPATVYVDGRKAGRSPQFVKVSAGSHTVKWKWDDGKTDTQKVSIGDKESKLLKGSK